MDWTLLMTYKCATALALLLAPCAQPLLAQSLPGNHELSGWIELEQFFAGSFSDTLIAADVTLKLRPDSLNGVGFDFGVQGVQAEGFGASAIYATVVMPLAGGELSFGLPRSAIREIFGSRAIAGAQGPDLELGLLTQPDYMTSFNILVDSEIYGLRYDNTYDATRVSAGLFQVDDATGAQVALEYSLSNTKLRLGLETLSAAGSNSTNLATLGKVELAGIVRRLDGPGGSLESLRLDADYAISDAFKLSASYFTASQGFGDMLGLSGEYTFTKTAYVQAGMLNFAGSDLYDISLGVKF
jgi:hypothetical protein